MQTKKILSLFILSLISSLYFISCTVQKSEEPAVVLTVSAAASLREVMEEIAPLYQAQHPKTLINYNFGSSGTLQQQIEQGAPVDIFISAGDSQMNALKTKELLVEDTYRNLVKNTVVLVVPISSTAAIASFTDLNQGSIQAIGIGNPASVPAGQYAQEVLTSLRIFESLQSKLIYGKDVRQVVTYVETGSVDAAIVYATDAKLSEKVKIVATAPDNSHSPVIYPIAVIKSSANLEAAKEFVNFLFTDTPKTIFEQQGFTVF